MWGVNREDLVKGSFRHASPDGASGRRAREFETIAAMLRIYCRSHHRPKEEELCPECAALRDYAHKRLAHCRFGEDKPTCVRCPVHCYKADMRERVREVMRWAGPRMLWRHPLLALRHLVDEHRTPPVVGRPR